MTTDQFCMWLHGYLEISNPKAIGEKETQIIKDHLDILFNKETPDHSIITDGTDFKKIYEDTVKIKTPLSELLKRNQLVDQNIDLAQKQHGPRCSCQICYRRLVSPI